MTEVYLLQVASVYSFHIHVLSNSSNIFLVYPEYNGKNGSDDIWSMLNKFFYNYLDSTVRKTSIFWDSWLELNKNYTLIRFLHHLIHFEHRFDYIKITFPIKGHFYLECDQNFDLINKKSHTEVSKDWIEVLKAQDSNPHLLKYLKQLQSLQ